MLGLQVRHVGIFEPHSGIGGYIVRILQLHRGVNRDDSLEYFCVGHEQESSQDSHRIRSQQSSHDSGISACKDDGTYQDPDVEGKGKLQPSVCVGIHSIIETGGNAEVKVHPGYEYCEDIYVIVVEEEDFVSLYNVCVEYDTVYESCSHCQSEEGEKSNQHYSCSSKCKKKK